MSDLQKDLAALRIEREPERAGAARWIVWTGLVIVLAALGFAGWRWVTRERPVEVQVATVSVRAAGTQAAVLNASGYVVARRRATVSSKITGKVVEVDVEEGKNVVQGQVLARLDDSAPRAALALAEAQAEAARRGLRENEVRLDRRAWPSVARSSSCRTGSSRSCSSIRPRRTRTRSMPTSPR